MRKKEVMRRKELVMKDRQEKMVEEGPVCLVGEELKKWETVSVENSRWELPRVVGPMS